ncbi:Lysine exporter protein (LYSE/YGGA) [Pseudodesulfovibrio profundus]|uniref:Lysine exporter protein (LYSE/YGGA) n=1 Tax=Pseudodesulfovibrio profundus TaxID=57320 RepID=A0A2C8F9V8_9BACT|nr:LysE family translocator [Pseudodesulfovibrio profundus]SOB58815.1 Lysine exporter protein (LYSE/YGGA) [Pseudodesulfovibrio profundus]
MFGIHDIALFIVSGLLLNITPGQDVAYIVSRGAGLGWRGGAIAALGVGTGCFVHVFAASLGLSALLATSATAFTVVKLAGAGYLIWIGLTMWRGSNGNVKETCLAQRPSLHRIFTQGFLTNALNPKVALFFLAFLPQFVSADSTTKPLAFLLLGVLFTINGTMVNLGWAWFAARAARLLKGSGRFSVWIKRVAGTLFIGLGIRLALAKAA